MRVLRLIVIPVVLGLAACGGGEDEPTDRPAASGGDPKQVFASTCGGCHALADAGTSGRIGPDLDQLKPDAARVVTAIENGPGSMPQNLLSGEDAQAVADYVAEAAGS